MTLKSRCNTAPPSPLFNVGWANGRTRRHRFHFIFKQHCLGGRGREREGDALHDKCFNILRAIVATMEVKTLGTIDAIFTKISLPLPQTMLNFVLFVNITAWWLFGFTNIAGAGGGGGGVREGLYIRLNCQKVVFCNIFWKWDVFPEVSQGLLASIVG